VLLLLVLPALAALTVHLFPSQSQTEILAADEIGRLSPFLSSGYQRTLGEHTEFVGRLNRGWDYLPSHQRTRVIAELGAELRARMGTRPRALPPREGSDTRAGGADRGAGGERPAPDGFRALTAGRRSTNRLALRAPMPNWTPQLLLFVFVTHLPFFAWRCHRTRELRYAATTLTFALLVVAYALRIFAPEASSNGAPLHPQVRTAALLSAAVSVGLLVHHHWRRAAQGPRRRRKTSPRRRRIVP
jgi:hypothetical protein